ncbi:MAG: RNA polymerase Rpb4 family protein [Candidatus Saliniplasma sp.]
MAEESRYVSLTEVKELLEKEAEEREISYEQSLALSHAEKFVKLDVEETEELIDKLQEEFKFMKEELAYKTADILPTEVDGVLAVFSKDRYTPSKDEAEDIINLIKKYVEG